MLISEMQLKIDQKRQRFLRQKYLKLFSENLHIAMGILVIGSQSVNKQSEDLRCD